MLIQFVIFYFFFFLFQPIPSIDMRIAIITENFLPKVDGVTRTLARLLEHLQATSHQVLVLGPESDMTTYAGAEIVGTFGVPFFPYPELKFNFWRPLFTRKLIDFNPDVIHLVDPVFLGAFGLAAVRYYLPHVPIVSSYHTNLAVYCDHFGFGFLTSIMWRWNQFCHSFSRFVACPSPSTMTILTEHGFDHVRIWPRGVDISLFSPSLRSQELRAQWMDLPLSYANSKSVILYVGRVSFEKNINLVVDAYRGMDHSQCHLVIVGHGPAFDEIQRTCSTNAIPVTFTGYLQGKDLSQAYASADMFAFPSVTETFGQVVLESMASGLPVVGLEAEGVKDLVDHQRTGLLLNTEGLAMQDQVTQYRGLLETLVTQKQTCAKMRREAIMEAKRYTWFEAMDCMVQVYENAMGCSEDELPTSIRLVPSTSTTPLLLSNQKKYNHHTKQKIANAEEDDSGVEEDYEVLISNNTLKKAIHQKQTPQTHRKIILQSSTH